MAPFRWIQMSSLLILMLPFKGTTEQHLLTQDVTAGHDVTLPCKSLKKHQHECHRITWLFVNSGYALPLFERGENKSDKPKSDRLSLTVNCSLVIKKVTDQDAGLYTCRRFRKNHDYKDSGVQLSVTNSDNAATTEKTTTGTLPTTQSAKPTTEIHPKTTEGVKTSEGTTATNSSAEWLWLVIGSVGLAAFLVTVVLIIIWKKTEEKTQRGNNTGRSLKPTDTQCDPGSTQDTADGSYASITFSRQTKNKAQAHGDDDGNTVVYSTVKASSASAGV